MVSFKVSLITGTIFTTDRILVDCLSFRCVGLNARDVKDNEDYICRRCIVKNPVGESETVDAL